MAYSQGTQSFLSIEHMFETLTADQPAPANAGPASVAVANPQAGSFAGSHPGSFAGSFEMAFAQLSDAVAAMLRAGVPADARALVLLRSRLDQLAALVAEAFVRFDTHELWRDEGAGSMRDWLSDACGLSRADASREVRRCERLEQWPEISTSWIEGSLSGAQVDAIVAGVPNRFVALFAGQAAAVVPLVTPLDVVDTAKAIKHWVECASAEDDPDQLRERPSGLYCDRLLDGHLVLQGTFDGTDTAIIEAALRVFDIGDPSRDSIGSSGGNSPDGSGGNSPDGSNGCSGQSVESQRTPAQRRAAALVEACRFALDHRDGAGENGRFHPHVSLIVDINDLLAAGLRVGGARRANHDTDAAAEVSDSLDLGRSVSSSSVAGSSVASSSVSGSVAGRVSGSVSGSGVAGHGTGITSEGTYLGATALAALTCDSVVQRVLMAGNRVLDLGREVRTATPAQRRAIIARDLHCRAPGCRTLPKHCEVHRVDHWINGGRTDLDRMVLLCGTHHRQFHRPGYRMELDEQATFTVHAPQGWTRSSIPERINASGP